MGQQQNDDIPLNRRYAAGTRPQEENDIPINLRHAEGTRQTRTPTADLREEVLAPLARPASNDWLPAIVVCMLAAFTLVAIVTTYYSLGHKQAPVAEQSRAPLRARDIRTQQIPSNRPLAQSTSPNRGSSQSSSASNERTGQGGAATTTGDGPAMRSPDGGNQSARQAYRQSESSRPQPVASNPLDAQRSSQLQDQTSQRTPAPASDAPTTLPSDSGQSKQSDTKSHASREWQKSEDTPPERPRADTRVPLLPPPPDFSKGRR